ncbi:hypothetical protein SAMN04487857_110189 [Pseudomonas sp. ok272]|nr:MULTISPECIES: pilus assembly protein [unclassified Pseudomonas]SEN14679.1 hypothetical protein SAMN04487857_110189 [Pseudomonas sp. ok272]SFN07129.1 hypothetical protein SAMN04487858_111190 [Pseudomonas sp. ok602]
MKVYLKFLFGVLGGCLLVSSAWAAPQINVGVVYDYLDGKQSTYLKRVYNGGTSTAFVKVNILEIVYDAEGVPREVPLSSEGATGSRDGLIASPARLIVPSKGMQGTRLLYQGERDKERYFRVRFVPVLPEKEDQFAVSEEEREAYKSTISAGVNILAGYGTVFFVRPKDTRFDTRIEDTQARYTVRNAGNSVVVLDEFRDCELKDEHACAPTTKHHVLAGKSYSFDKAPGRQYRFKLIEGSAQRKVEIQRPAQG